MLKICGEDFHQKQREGGELEIEGGEMISEGNWN
jgi:hypothetical protein